MIRLRAPSAVPQDLAALCATQGWHIELLESSAAAGVCPPLWGAPFAWQIRPQEGMGAWSITLASHYARHRIVAAFSQWHLPSQASDRWAPLRLLVVPPPSPQWMNNLLERVFARSGTDWATLLPAPTRGSLERPIERQHHLPEACKPYICVYAPSAAPLPAEFPIAQLASLWDPYTERWMAHARFPMLRIDAQGMTCMPFGTSHGANHVLQLHNFAQQLHAQLDRSATFLQYPSIA